MLANFDVTPSFLFMVLLACNKLQPSKTQASQGCPVSPCQYGGTCENNICRCPPGLTGPTCSNVDCNDFPCYNGGTCVPGPTDMCICPHAGFVQPFCTTSCQNTFFACVNGVCVGDVCNCDTNFAGPTCESAIAAYLSPSWITVTEGHIGQKAVTLQVCRQPSSEEVTLQVSTTAGTASPEDADFVDIPVNPRQDVTISSGQPCTPVNVSIISDLIQEMSEFFFLNLNDPQPSSSSMVHIVTDSTIITITDDDHGPCDTDPCLNGGNCLPLNTPMNGLNFLCICDGVFTGQTCEEVISPCDPNPCLNGAACTPTVGSEFTCTCLDGFTGDTCGDDMPCSSDPCLNRGTCFDLDLTGFFCQCPSGFAGQTCATDTDPPVISNCPISRSVSITPGTSSTSVSWPPPTATDNSGDVTLMSSHQPGDTFPLGQTFVTYTATDGAGNTDQCQFVITVVIDVNSPPQIGPCPTEINTVPSGNQFLLQFTTPSCTDPNGDQVTVTCIPAAGSNIANILGVITCTCTDSSQATDSVVCPVNQPPTVQCPAAFSVTSATAQFNTPQCVDNQQANFLATCTPSSGSPFNAGPNTVVCTCQDSEGLTDSCTFTITVQNGNSPPQIGPCPTEINTVPSGDQFFLLFTTPSCTDPNGDTVTVTCNPAAGSTIANIPGFITCTCTDSSQTTDSVTCPDCTRLNSAGLCSSGECSCTYRTCTSQTGRCEATCSAFQCLANIASESVSQVNPQSSVEIKCILEGSTAVVNKLQIRLSRSEGAIDDHIITQDTNPDISANRREVTDRVISVSEDDQFFCILSLGPSIVGSINVIGFVYKLPSISDPPTELTRTTTSVTITWRPWDEATDVGDPPVVAYIPYYKMDPSQDWMSGSRIQADQALEYTASSLESDRNYTFSVAAIREGEGGEGPRGPAVTLKTLCIEVVPQMVTTTLTATNDVTVTWQQPTVQCSIGITQFTIYYEIEGDVSSRHEAGRADPNAESFTVNGSLLEPGTTYNIAVTVTTDQESALSEGRTVTATNPTDPESAGSSVAIIIVAVIVVLIVLILLFLIVIVVRKRKMEDQPDPIDNQPLNDLGKQSEPSGNTYHSSGAVNTALNVTKAKKTKESSAASSSVIDVGGIYGNLEPPSPIRIAEFPEYIISNIDKVEHEFGLLEGSQQKHPWTVADQEYNRKKNRFRNMYPYDHCRVVLPKLPGDHHSDYYNASFILNERDVRAYIASQGPNKASVDDFWRLIWEQNVQTIVMLANLYEETKERCLQYWPKEENEIQSFGYFDVTWTKTQHFADYEIRTLSVDRGGTIREVKQLHFKEWPDKDIPDNAMCLVEFARHCKLIHFKKQTPLLIHCSAGIGRTGTFIGLLSMMDVLQSKEYIDIFAFVNKMRENRVNMIQTKKQYRYLHTCLYEFHLTRDCQISSQILSRFKVHDNKAAILREFELLSEMEMSITNDSIKTGGTKDSLARGNSTDSLETDGSMTREHAPRDRFGNMVPVERRKVFMLSSSPSNPDNYINASFVKTGGTTDSLARGNSTDSLETDGSMAREHAPRDRFGNMVPVERRKVFMLSSSPSNPDNYINASFVKSYEKKDAFITTQSPLPNTIEDFWRMIYDHKCRTVVMLNQLDGSDKTCVQYWPDRGSLHYGIMTVTCITTEQQSDYVKRTFDVTLNDSANVISVTHLQLEQWPPNGSPQSVIRLITDAQKLQKEANVDKPLVVHCINGFGRSGVFATVQSEMERIRATGLVDIFATVKKLRNEHQHMMRKKMDYILCFDFLIEFSKRYGNYENW